MIRRLFICCFVPVFFFASQIGAQEKSSPSTPLQTKAKPEALIAHLQQRIPQLMQEGEVPALVIALIREGKLVWHHSFGVKNTETKEPVTDSTIFEAASLSKPVFTYAVLKLVDRGQFDLDKPLNQYLPGHYDVGDDPRLNQIIARRVLSHTTGFPNWRPQNSPTLKIFFTPGEKFSYSGEGFVYLAKVVEHITGEPFDAFMKKTVFDPLGMNGSSYIWQDKYERLKADRHNFIGKPTGLNKVTEANAAASLNTTASDYGKFVAAILKGTGLKKETGKLMLTPQIYVDEACTNCTTRPLEKLSSQVAWGLGWGLQNTDEGISFWHWGTTATAKHISSLLRNRRSASRFLQIAATAYPSPAKSSTRRWEETIPRSIGCITIPTIHRRKNCSKAFSRKARRKRCASIAKAAPLKRRLTKTKSISLAMTCYTARITFKTRSLFLN